MKVAILGFDVEGHASFDYFAAQGHHITICDQNPEVNVPEGVDSVLGESYLDNLNRFDLLVRTAGLPPHKILENNPGLEPRITTHINEFLKACPTKNVIGITGTKGKGTTSTLVTKMLEATGKSVKLGGNIGLAPLTFLPELTAESWVVLELSSFQLIDIKRSPRIAVCLMVVPEHLNWHEDLEDYTTAKSQLFQHQSSDDVAVYFAGSELSKLIVGGSPGRKIPYYAPPGAIVKDGNITIDDKTICSTDELKLLGKHNWQNVCAAVTTVWQADTASQNVNIVRSVLTSFSGLEHRLEFVRELDGISYYNDSFGTTPETAIVAIEAFKQPEVVILGGSIKGSSFDELATVIASGNVRRVVLIGNTTNPDFKPAAPEIEAALHAHGFDSITSLIKPAGVTMDEIIDAARAGAQPGDIVLLSTGCASFDIFDNYKQRGLLFKQAVQALA